MAYVDHPKTTVSSMASKSRPKYTSYQAHTEVLVNTNMIDVSTDLSSGGF